MKPYHHADRSTVCGTGSPNGRCGDIDDLSWSDMDEEERLDVLDGFLVETKQFTEARKTITRGFKRWRKGKDGRLFIVHGPSGSGKTTVADVVLEDIETMVGGAVNVGAPREPDEHDDEDDDVPEDENVPEGDDGNDEDDVAAIGRLPPTAGIVMEGPNGVMRPVLKVFVEAKTRSPRLLRDIVRGLGIKPAMRATALELVETLKTQIEGQGVRMIILDEVHHIVTNQGADIIKTLLVQARIQVVGIGLPHAKHLASDAPDDDLERHLHATCPMDQFPCDGSEDGEWRVFLHTLSQEMPFDLKPDFSEAGLSLRLHAATDGLVGKLMSLIEVAAEIAIDKDHETIGIDTLDSAFRKIYDVGKLATPFSMKSFDAEAWKPMQELLRKRKKMLKAAADKARMSATPNFKKR